MSVTTKHVAISGHAEPGFEAVADAFAENYVSRNELGAACCRYVDGAEIVDLWSGVQNCQTREPWERITMVIDWSATKGIRSSSRTTTAEGDGFRGHP